MPPQREACERHAARLGAEIVHSCVEPGRRLTAEYTRRILREADTCKKTGEVGALLRREGLHSWLMTEWRKRRERGSLAALDRSRAARKADPREAQIARLQRRLERAEDRA
jgi:transposase